VRADCFVAQFVASSATCGGEVLPETIVESFAIAVLVA